MSFEELLAELKNGKNMEQLTEGFDVECIENEVYEDEDLYTFLAFIGAEIEDFGVGYAEISTSSGKVYEVPYENRQNRFDDDLPDETILFFDHERIYDVTDSRKE